MTMRKIGSLSFLLLGLVAVVFAVPNANIGIRGQRILDDSKNNLEGELKERDGTTLHRDLRGMRHFRRVHPDRANQARMNEGMAAASEDQRSGGGRNMRNMMGGMQGARSSESRSNSNNKSSGGERSCRRVCAADDKQLCAKQCLALEMCTSEMVDHILGNHYNNWSQLLNGDVVDWAELLKDFISKAPSGMHYHDQEDFCDGLNRWISFQEGRIGLCAIIHHYPSARGDGCGISQLRSCEDLGFRSSDHHQQNPSNRRRRVQEDNPTDPQSGTCNITLDATISPTQCFVPDDAKYYSFKASRDGSAQLGQLGEFGFLAHNYEFVDCDEIGATSGQRFTLPTWCSTEISLAEYNINYCEGYGNDPGPGPQFLIGGHILQDVNDTRLTHAMWRFKQEGAQPSSWEIANRRSGLLLNVGGGRYTACLNVATNVAVASTTSNGCSFCSWTAEEAPFGYTLACYDESTGSNINFANPSTAASWMNFNQSLSSDEYASGALNNKFCVEEVTDFQRADVYALGAVSYTAESPSAYSTAAKYTTDSLSIASALLGPAGFAGVSAGLRIITTLFPMGSAPDQTEQIQEFGNAIIALAEAFAEDTVAENNVKTAATTLTNERGFFSCNYVNQLINLVDSSPSDSSGFCSLLNTAQTWGLAQIFNTAYNAWSQLPPTDWGDIVQQETARLGWDTMQVGIADLTLVMEEQMFLYSYVAKKYGSQSDLCGVPLPADSDDDICGTLAGELFVNVGQFQSAFFTAVSDIIPKLSELRVSSTIQGTAVSGGDDSDCNGITNTTLCSEDDYLQYSWEDTFFQPTPLSQAFYQIENSRYGYPDIPSDEITSMYLSELLWDMSHWSYFTALDIDGVTTSLTDLLDPSTNHYMQSFLDLCSTVYNDEDEAMANHTTQLNVPNRCTVSPDATS